MIEARESKRPPITGHPPVTIPSGHIGASSGTPLKVKPVRRGRLTSLQGDVLELVRVSARSTDQVAKALGIAFPTADWYLRSLVKRGLVTEGEGQMWGAA